MGCTDSTVLLVRTIPFTTYLCISASSITYDSPPLAHRFRIGYGRGLIDHRKDGLQLQRYCGVEWKEWVGGYAIYMKPWQCSVEHCTALIIEWRALYSTEPCTAPAALLDALDAAVMTDMYSH